MVVVSFRFLVMCAIEKDVNQKDERSMDFVSEMTVSSGGV